MTIALGFGPLDFDGLCLRKGFVRALASLDHGAFHEWNAPYGAKCMLPSTEISPNVFYKQFGSPTGTAAVRRTMVPFVALQGRVDIGIAFGVTVFVVRDPTMPNGIRIHTAYPSPSILKNEQTHDRLDYTKCLGVLYARLYELFTDLWHCRCSIMRIQADTNCRGKD